MFLNSRLTLNGISRCFAKSCSKVDFTLSGKQDEKFRGDQLFQTFKGHRVYDCGHLEILFFFLRIPVQREVNVRAMPLFLFLFLFFESYVTLAWDGSGLN